MDAFVPFKGVRRVNLTGKSAMRTRSQQPDLANVVSNARLSGTEISATTKPQRADQASLNRRSRRTDSLSHDQTGSGYGELVREHRSRTGRVRILGRCVLHECQPTGSRQASEFPPLNRRTARSASPQMPVRLSTAR